MTVPGARDEVRLEPVSLAHAEAMFRWMTDAEVRENIGLRTEPTPEKTRAWIQTAVNDPATRAFAVMHRDAHVGNVVLDRIDQRLKLARLSIYIGERPARGTGVGTAAVTMALRVAFGELGLHKVYLTVHAENAPAIALYERAGFRREGVLREEFLLGGRRVDAIYMGILRREAAPAAGAGAP
jgi:diamine N-acetyltransferase